MVKRKLKHIATHRWQLKLALAAGAVLLFATGFGASYLYKEHQTNALRSRYNLLSRRVLLDNPNDIILNFQDLKGEYDSYLRANGLQDKASIYFEYLPSGSSIGINEDKERTGASLLKLPLAISFYKLVEQGKLSLDTKVKLKQEWLNQSYGTLYEKGAGYELTYRQIIDYALQESDNTAALALYEAVSGGQNTDTPDIINFVDINYATNAQKNILVGVEGYSSILKCLYFSCYLNRDDSQQLLKTLTGSVDQSRLALYTPEDLVIAHKIGTYTTTTQSDCGIAYLHKRNYVLCVMIDEPDPQASKMIADLSLITYDFLAPKEETR